MSDRTTWGEEAHVDLLVAVLNHVAIPNSDWDSKILPELRAKGYTYTLSAALYALSTQLIRSYRLPSRSSLVQHTNLQPPATPLYTLTFPPHSSTFSRSNHFQNPVAIIMGTPTKGPAFKWDPASERDLFAACLVAADEPKGATLTKAMEILEENFGERFTKKAATHRLQHLQKLKRKEGGGAPKKTATPNKRNKPATEGDDDEAPKKKKQRKTTIKAASAHADDQDDDEDVELQLKNEEGENDGI
ncbi:hypothetical protein FJTKL_00387 [Diaporthe vaccinii]|uniref:Uncharacterized protein n=1 Tax=Diaporthe vaccinii TaxID=105482 RepID=A0ABR4E3D9_9PEZI